MQSIAQTVELLRNLGFTIDANKSVLTPTQSIEFLGFIIDSRTMTVTLSEEKRNRILLKIRAFLAAQRKTIRELSSVIGSLISTFPAIPFGP